MTTQKLVLIVVLAFLLTACATPAPIAAPTLAATLTVTVAPSPTLTPTTTATAIPVTPVYEGNLSYNPETHALSNPQGTPVFTLSDDGAWKGLTPEVPVEIMAGLEAEGYQDIEIEDKYGTQIITGEDKDGGRKRDILGLYTEEYGWDVEKIGADLDFFGKGDYLEEHEGKVHVINEYGVASGIWNAEKGEWGSYTPPLDVVGKKESVLRSGDGAYKGIYLDLENEANQNMEELIIRAEENVLFDKNEEILSSFYGEKDGKIYVKGIGGPSRVFITGETSLLAHLVIIPGIYKHQGIIFFTSDYSGNFGNMQLPIDKIFPERIDVEGAGDMLEYVRGVSFSDIFLLFQDDLYGKQIIVSFTKNSGGGFMEEFQDEYDDLVKAIREGTTFDSDDDSFFHIQDLIWRGE